MARPRDAGDFFSQILFEAPGIHNRRPLMRHPHDQLQLLFRNRESLYRLSLEISCGRRRQAMLERPLLRRPFHPATVQNAQIPVAEIFEHPEHPAFIPPIIKRIGVDDDVALLIDSKPPKRLLDRAEIRIQQSLRHSIRIAVLMPGGMHGAGNVPAELIRRPAAHIEYDQARLAQSVLQCVGIDQQRMIHDIPLTGC